MNTESRELNTVVREGYQILLRARARLVLPTEQKKIAAYYEALSEKCMAWATEVHGEMLREQLAAFDSVHEKARMGCETYRFDMRIAWEDETLCAILCESRLLGQNRTPVNSYHRLSHVWNLCEESILPARQILSAFDIKPQIGFAPDGIYPEGREMVFFRNPRGSVPFAEERIALDEREVTISQSVK